MFCDECVGVWVCSVHSIAGAHVYTSRLRPIQPGPAFRGIVSNIVSPAPGNRQDDGETGSHIVISERRDPEGWNSEPVHRLQKLTREVNEFSYFQDQVTIRSPAVHGQKQFTGLRFERRKMSGQTGDTVSSCCRCTSCRSNPGRLVDGSIANETESR